MLGTISGFVRALGAFASIASPTQAPRIQQYVNKTADLIDLATAGTSAWDRAQEKLESDTKTMMQWVDTGYEPTEADFDAIEGRIDELHDRFAALRKTPPTESP